MFAARDNRLAVVDKMIELGCDINHVNQVRQLYAEPFPKIVFSYSGDLYIVHFTIFVSRS